MTLRTNEFCRGLLFAAVAVLAACTDKPESAGPTASATAKAEAAPVVAANPTETTADLMRRANNAFLANKILSPVEDNAVELFLKVRDLDPQHPGLGEALVEIMPLANYGFESALRSGDVPEADRLLVLMQRLNAESHAVKAAADNLTQLRKQIAQSAALADAQKSAVAATNDLTPVTPTPKPALATRETPATEAPAAKVASPAQTTPMADKPVAAAAQTDPTTPAAQPRKSTTLIAPIAIAKVTPEYPSQARRRNVEGFVELEFVVNELGGAEDIRVVRSEPQGTFDRSAVRALMRWRFKPAERDGKPEVAKTRTTVNFRQG